MQPRVVTGDGSAGTSHQSPGIRERTPPAICRGLRSGVHRCATEQAIVTGGRSLVTCHLSIRSGRRGRRPLRGTAGRLPALPGPEIATNTKYFCFFLNLFSFSCVYVAERKKGGAGMPNDTGFAELYKKLVEHSFEANPERLARTRSRLIAQLSAHCPTAQSKWAWTKTPSYDTITITESAGEKQK